MTTGSTETVTASLEEASVTTERTSLGSFADVVDEVVKEPAVGVPLDEFEVSLSETRVTVDPTPAALRGASTGVTPASLCVTDYGSLALPTRDDGSELVSLFVEHHVAVLHEDDFVEEMETAFERFGSDPDLATASRILATGPSATADMGELVEGAHGPKDVTAIVLED